MMKSQMAIRTSEVRYRRLFETARDGILILDPRTRNWFEIFGKVALTGQPVRFVNEARRLKGWFDVYAFRLGGEESRKVAVLFTNITERRQTERALLTAKNRSSRHTLDEYGSKLDEQGVHYLHQIMCSAVRLDRLIQDVLSYTRVLHVKLPMGPIDLDRLVRDMIEMFPNPDESRIKPKIQIKGTLPRVIGNEALLAQCVFNLLSNGTKFVSEGTTPRVEISAEAVDNSTIQVRFKDNGIGIAPENHNRIFRLFEQIHPAAEHEGTGIGLTIVRKELNAWARRSASNRHWVKAVTSGFN